MSLVLVPPLLFVLWPNLRQIDIADQKGEAVPVGPPKLSPIKPGSLP